MLNCVEGAVGGGCDDEVIIIAGGGDGVVADSGGGRRMDVSRFDDGGKQTRHDGVDEALASVQGLTTCHGNLK